MPADGSQSMGPPPGDDRPQDHVSTRTAGRADFPSGDRAIASWLHGYQIGQLPRPSPRPASPAHPHPLHQRPRRHVGKPPLYRASCTVLCWGLEIVAGQDVRPQVSETNFTRGTFPRLSNYRRRARPGADLPVLSLLELANREGRRSRVRSQSTHAACRRVPLHAPDDRYS